MSERSRDHRNVRPSDDSLAWNRSDVQVVADADVEIERPRLHPPDRAAATRRGCSRTPSAARTAVGVDRGHRTPGTWKRSLASGRDAPARRQQVGAAAAQEQHALVSRSRPVEERPRTPPCRARRVAAQDVARRRCRRAAARGRDCPSAFRDSTISRSPSPICPAICLEPGDDARVLDVLQRPAAAARSYCTPSSGEEDDADRPANEPRRRRTCRALPLSAAAAAKSSAAGRMTGRNRRAIQKCSGTMRIL